ncbi:unnamed protein product [Discosporangium mesarthrocarpum]
MPDLAQVVTVRGGETLVVKREGLGLKELRKIYISLDQSGTGEVGGLAVGRAIRKNPILHAAILHNGRLQVMESEKGRTNATGHGSGSFKQSGKEFGLTDPLAQAILWSWQRHEKNRAGEGPGSRSAKLGGSGRECSDGYSEHKFVTWRKFVEVFLALGDSGCGACAGRKDEGPGLGPRAEKDGGGECLEDGELEDLWVAFSSISHGNSGVTEPGLRAASAELDGVALTEAFVKRALGVSDTDLWSGNSLYDFDDFVRLRCSVARYRNEGGDEIAGFVGGWRWSALKNLRRCDGRGEKKFLDVTDEGNGNRAKTSEMNTAPEFVEPESFVNAVAADPATRKFLNLPALGHKDNEYSGGGDKSKLGRKGNARNRTIQTALEDIRECSNNRGVNWESIEMLLFGGQDDERSGISIPQKLFQRPPLTASVGAGMRGEDGTEKGDSNTEVYEISVDPTSGVLYVLLVDGELRSYHVSPGDAFRPLQSTQLITYDPCPKGRSEGSEEHGEWRQRARVDSAEGNCANTHLVSKALARRLLYLRPAARILLPSAVSGTLLVNTSAGDRCIRFHETHAFRRIGKVRLELPPAPLHHELGLFEVARDASGGSIGGIKKRSASAGLPVGISGDGEGAGSTDCSVLDMVFLEESVLICIVGGRPYVTAFCADTGLILASFVGHSLRVTCILNVASQAHIVTGSDDKNVRVWDVGRELLSHVVPKWERMKRSFFARVHAEGKALVRNTAVGSGAGGRAPEVTSLEKDQTLFRYKDVAEAGEKNEDRGSDDATQSRTDGTNLWDLDVQPELRKAAKRALSALRPELARQSGAKPRWRMGRITAVLEQEKLGLPLARGTAGGQGGGSGVGYRRGKEQSHPMVEVTYDDGEIELDVSPHLLRQPEEAKKYDSAGKEVTLDREEHLSKAWGMGNNVVGEGPDWGERPLRAEVGARVAIYGMFDGGDISKLLPALLRASDQETTSSSCSPDPTNEESLLKSLRRIRDAAARAVALQDPEITSPRAVEVALDASEVDPRDLEALASALAAAATSASRSGGGGRRGVEKDAEWAALSREVTILFAEATVSVDQRWRRGSDEAQSNALSDGRLSVLHLVPCKRALSGHTRSVTSLGYMPISMLLVSGDSAGKIRFWDPCATHHKLAPPIKSSSFSYPSPRAMGRGQMGAGGGRHVRLWPGVYMETPEEWTEEGEPFSCVAEFDVNTGKGVGGVQRKDGSGRYAVQDMKAVVVSGQPGACSVECDSTGEEDARGIDAWIESGGDGDGGLTTGLWMRGFLYLMDDGSIESISAPRGFHRRYVLLEDASFFEVWGALSVEGGNTPGASSGGCGVASHSTSLRTVFRQRQRVRRIIYAALRGLTTLEVLATAMISTGSATGTRASLSSTFPDSRFSVFYRRGDGPSCDITLSRGDLSGRDIGSDESVSDDRSDSPQDPHLAKEFLHVELRGGEGNRGHGATVRGLVLAVGRISLRVEARRFDEPLLRGEKVAAVDAFLAAWGLHWQRLRGLCETRAAASRGRSNAESLLLSRMQEGLRLCSLDRRCGQPEPVISGYGILERAFVAALGLPSRIPQAALRGALVQAKKVFSNLVEAGHPIHGRRKNGDLLPYGLLVSAIRVMGSSQGTILSRHYLSPPVLRAVEVKKERNPTPDSRTGECFIGWNKFQSVLTHAVIRSGRMPPEEAYTLLVKLGQVPAGGGLLEVFFERVRRGDDENALDTARSHHDTSGSMTQRPPTSADGHLLERHQRWVRNVEASPEEERRQERVNEKRTERGDIEYKNDGEWRWIGPREFADLAAVFDPLTRVNEGFMSLEHEMSDLIRGRNGIREQEKSLLERYAMLRQCRTWKKRLEAVGDALITARLAAGRRGIDILLAASQPEVSLIPLQRTAAGGKLGAEGICERAEVSAAELLAEAEALSLTLTRRQGGRGVMGAGDVNVILAARMHRYCPLEERRERGTTVYEGWGYHGHDSLAQGGGQEGRGEPVAILEVSPERSGEIVGRGRAGKNGSDGQHSLTFGDHMKRVVALLSVPPLHYHPGLLRIHPTHRVIVEEYQVGEGDGAEGRQSHGKDVPQDQGVEPVVKRDLSSDHNASPPILRLVTERLGGWLSLSEVTRTRGPLLGASFPELRKGWESGLRVLRLWGAQIGSALECLHSRSLVLRDCRPETVLVSPDGSRVKVSSFAHLALVGTDGHLLDSTDSPDLDTNVFGPGESITPPEALTRRPHNCSSNHSKDYLVTLGNSGTSQGAFRETQRWDVWTLGILLYELAFGCPPTPFGYYLGRAVAAADISAAATGKPLPSLGAIASALQYDFFLPIPFSGPDDRDRIGDRNPGIPTHNTYQNILPLMPEPDMRATRPLTAALECMSLGAAIGRGGTYTPSVRIHLGNAQDSGAMRACEAGRELLSMERAWNWQQLIREVRGERASTSWQDLLLKMRRHIDVSVAGALGAFTPETGAGPGARRRVNGNSLDARVGAYAEPGGHDSVVAKAMTILKTADPRQTGLVQFRTVRSVLEGELMIPLTETEAKMLGGCLRYVEGGAGGEEENFNCPYKPLENILCASISLPPNNTVQIACHGSRITGSSSAGESGVATGAGTGEDGGLAAGSLSPSSFVEVLCKCLEPDPQRRTSAPRLLRMPFFSDMTPHTMSPDSADHAAAASYMNLSGKASVLSLRDLVSNPLDSLANAAVAALPSVLVSSHGNDTCLSAGGGSRDSSIGTKGEREGFDASRLASIFRDLNRFVRRPAESSLAGDPFGARRSAEAHVTMIDTIFAERVLTRATALVLRFLDLEEARTAGRAIPGVGFVEGDPNRSIGSRILLILIRTLRNIISDLSRNDSPVAAYVDVLLRCLTSLYMGEEGALAVKYGRIGPSILTVGTCINNTTEEGESMDSGRGIASESGLCHWRPELSQVFEGLLLDMVGEIGTGNPSYPAIQCHIRRCGTSAGKMEESIENSWDSDEEGYDNPGNSWGIGGDDGPENNGLLEPELAMHIGGTVGTGGRDLLRSSRPRKFVRTSLYFGELFGLGRALCSLHAGLGSARGASERARKQGAAYCVTAVRMCCEGPGGGGGLEKVEPLGWMEGGRGVEEDAAVLQRAQLLVDFRLADKLAPFLHDQDTAVRRDTLQCAAFALEGGHSWLRWVPMAGVARGPDPRALLALSFCSPVWVSGLVAILRGPGRPQTGKAERKVRFSTREADGSRRRLALECFGNMAAAGDLATNAWKGLGVLPVLQSVLNRAPPYTQDLGTRNEPTDFPGWREVVTQVLRVLAENGSAKMHALVKSHVGLASALRCVQLVV